MSGVKRNYDGSVRRARAERVRGVLVDAAREMLLSEGYAATTVPRLADACGVSAESVYKRFAGKPALVRAVVAKALEGIGPVAAETRSDALATNALATGDLATLLPGWATLAAEVTPRVAPILLLVHAAAAHDPELAVLAGELDDDRRARMTDNARRIAEAGHLPHDLNVERAADILWTYSSPQMYDLLVLRSGWDIDQYADFIATGMAAHLSPGARPASVADQRGIHRDDGRR